MASVSPITFHNGVRIPQVGLGVWQVPADEVQQTVETALELGYRHIDGAAAYDNEEGVGAALKATGVDRDDIFVTTKLRNGEQGYQSALKAFDDSRKRLGLDVIDLYLIHWPSPKRDLYVETWKAFEKLYEEVPRCARHRCRQLPSRVSPIGLSAKQASSRWSTSLNFTQRSSRQMLRLHRRTLALPFRHTPRSGAAMT